MIIFAFFGIIAYLIYFTFSTQYTGWLEMIVYPYLANNGFSLYKDLAIPYTPLAVWFLQIVEKLFGFTPEVTRFVTLILSILNILLIYFITKKVWKVNNWVGVLSAGFYALWFFYFEGNALWFESFQTPLILGSFYFLYKYFFGKEDTKNLWIAGFLIASSFFIKQPTIWVIFYVSVWIIYFYRKNFLKIINSLFIFLAPLAILFITTSLIASFGNFLVDYWYWSFKYTFLELPFYPDNPNYPSINQIFKLGLIISPIIPFIFLHKKNLLMMVFMIGFLVASGMTVLPRWEFFHLQIFLAVFSVVAIPSLYRMINSRNIIGKIIVLILVSIWALVSVKQLIRFQDKPIRFFEPDIYKVAEVMKAKNYLDFYTQNSSDQLYVLTGTKPKVRPYDQYFYSFLEVHNMQQKIVMSLEKEKPHFIIYTPYSGKGGFAAGDYRPKQISDYIDSNYSFKEKINDQFWVLERN